jgi:hypothetical protein
MAKIMTRSEFESKKYDDEDLFAADFNMYVSHNYPSIRGYYYHVPNESQSGQHRKRGRFNEGDRHRLRNAAIGVMPGVLDYCFMIRNDGSRMVYHVGQWYLELKVGSNTLSPNQNDFIKRCAAYGIETFTAWTSIQAAHYVNQMLGEPKYP